jgi:hypothetical protein
MRVERAMSCRDPTAGWFTPLRGLAPTELPPAAELEQEQEYSPPHEKAGFVDDQVGSARIGDRLKPVIEVGEKVADRLDKSFGHDQGRPARRRVCRTWFWTRASVRLVNLLEDLLEASVLCDPCTNLRNQSWGT